MIKLGFKKGMNARSRSVAELNKKPLKGLNYDVMDLRDIPDEVSQSQHKSIDEELDSARKANKQILNDFDKLLHDSLYKWKKMKKPKFEFNQQQVAGALCDTYINEFVNTDNAAFATSLENITDKDIFNTSNKQKR